MEGRSWRCVWRDVLLRAMRRAEATTSAPAKTINHRPSSIQATTPKLPVILSTAIERRNHGLATPLCSLWSGVARTNSLDAPSTVLDFSTPTADQLGRQDNQVRAEPPSALDHGIDNCLGPASPF